ncbi:MAG: VOC family protein [Terriglobales bacterium]
MFNRLHHVAIICSDYPRSKHFYVEVLGFEIMREVYREDRGSFKLDLQVGGKYQIELFSFPNPSARVSSPEACGLRHIAFEVDDVQDAARRLRDRGVEVESIRIDETTNKSFTFFRDPDNLPIEIYER